MKNRRPYTKTKRSSLFNAYEQPVGATLQLLSLSGIKVANKEMSETILSHPDYPSLLAISDALHEWKIGNVATRIPKEDISDYPLPLLIHYDELFKLIIGIETDSIFLLDANGKEEKVPRQQFMEKWNAVALLAEPESEPVPPEKTVEEAGTANSGLLVTLGLVLIAASLYLLPSANLSILLLLDLAGIGVTTILLWYMLDKKNMGLKKICGAASGENNCAAILDSSKARLFKGLSWAEVGAFYFWGSFLTLALFPSTLGLLAWLCIAAIGFTVYSLVYQGLIAKKWCRLCLAVQAILVMKAIVSLLFGWQQHIDPVSIAQVAGMTISFGLPILLWYIVKPFLTSYFRNRTLPFEFARLKRNPVVVNAILQHQKIHPALPMAGIQLGKPKAAHNIVTVSNPYCPPCAKTHLELDKLVESGEVNAQLLFTATADPGDSKTPVVEHFLAIAEKGNEEMTRHALDDWYKPGEKDYEQFSGKYRVNGELKKQDDKIKTMAEWCKKAGITHTPTIYVDGHELPSYFTLADLKYLFAG